MQKESFCGLCDRCELDDPEFLKAVAKVKSYVDRFRVYWWAHCFPEEEGFSLPEFRKGLKWFLSHPECPGCKGGRGLEQCPIRLCALKLGWEHCRDCPELQGCERFRLILEEYPDHKASLLRQRQVGEYLRGRKAAR